MTRTHQILAHQGHRFVLVPLEHDHVLSPKAPSHEYSAVRERIERDSEAIDRFHLRIDPYLFCPELERVSREKTDDREPFWQNGYFSGLDARAAYAICAATHPETILEVGSGNSTKFFRKAIREHQTGTRIVSIDPIPRAEIDALCDRVIRKDVNEVDLSEFARLEPGDVLFWDGSHLVLNGADAVLLFLEVLPLLKPGVLLHIHDITLPFDYPADFDGRGYAEQYMLAAALLASDNLQVLYPVSFLARTAELTEAGVSFWLTKKAS